MTARASLAATQRERAKKPKANVLRKSYFTISRQEMLKIVQDAIWDGDFVESNNGLGIKQIIVTASKNIGIVFDDNDNEQYSKTICIVNSEKHGVHMYPCKS